MMKNITNGEVADPIYRSFINDFVLEIYYTWPILAIELCNLQWHLTFCLENLLRIISIDIRLLWKSEVNVVSPI